MRERCNCECGGELYLYNGEQHSYLEFIKQDGKVIVTMEDSDAYKGWEMNVEHVKMLQEFLKEV